MHTGIIITRCTNLHVTHRKRALIGGGLKDPLSNDTAGPGRP